MKEKEGIKEKVLMLVIGVLIGAIITSGVFLIINKTSTNNRNGFKQRMSEMTQNGEMPEPPSGMSGEQPPQMPSGETNTGTNSNSSTNANSGTNSSSSTNANSGTNSSSSTNANEKQQKQNTKQNLKQSNSSES